MGDCLYSSYQVPEGDFKLNRDSIHYTGGKMRGSDNIVWQSNNLKLDYILIEARNNIIFATSNLACNYAKIKAKHIYIPEEVDFSGCKFLGEVHIEPLENIKAMLTQNHEF